MEIKKMKDFCVLHLNFDMHIGNRCQAFPNDSYITDSSTECRSVTSIKTTKSQAFFTFCALSLAVKCIL